MVCCTAGLVAGCNTLNVASDTGRNTATAEPAPAKPGGLSENLNRFIETAMPGESLVVARSPWGNQREIVAQDYYHSASGKKCRAVQMLDRSQRFLCLDASGHWVPVRHLGR
jgi:hypothetical protein